MSDPEFGGLDFALGSVRGYRSWRVNVEGKLEALHQPGIWIPGENTAECRGYPSKELLPAVEGEDYRDRAEKIKAWKTSHEMMDCKHGFYAYFSATNIETFAPAVHGVIEGYGEVLIGTKGFRAMRARILAISTEAFAGIWNLDQFVVDKLRRNYPSVPFFESNFAMQAEFPADAGIPEMSA